MAGEITNPTPTPDVTATAPTADTTTPDYTQQTTPAQLTPPPAVQPATAPASAVSNLSGTNSVMGGGQQPKVHGFLGRVALGALGALASVGKATSIGQNLQNQNLERQQKRTLIQGEQQRQQLAQKTEERSEAQETRTQQTHDQEMLDKKLDYNIKVQNEAHTAFLNHINEDESIAKINDANNDFIQQLGAMGIDGEKVKQTFDTMGQSHATDMVNMKTAPVASGGTGNKAGLHLYSTADLDFPLTKDITIPTEWHVDPKTGELKSNNTVTIAANGHHTALEAWNLKNEEQRKGQIELAQWQQKQEAAAKAADTSKKVTEAAGEPAKEKADVTQKLSEADKNEAEAANQRAQAAQLGGEVMRHTSQQLVDGNEDPSQLTKRAKNYDAQMADADTYSMQKYGVHFDPAKASIDYKFAQNPQVQQTLRYLNSLTGKDGKSGNLQELVNSSNKLKRTDFPALNDGAAWARMEAGDPQIAAYHATLVEVADQVAKILQGGGTGNGTSDAKLKQAQDLFAQRFTKTQIQAIAGALHPLLGNRQREMIGNNRYLIKMFPEAVAPTGTVAIGTNNADGLQYYLDAQGKPLHVVGYGVQ